MPRIFLIGYRGTGKTLVSNVLGEKLRLKVIHMDDILAAKLGDIEMFVKNHGWDSFRNKETKLLIKISKEDNIIADCGGGIVARNENLKVLKRGLCFWLHADMTTISKRLENDPVKRPSLTSKSAIEEIEEILNQRIKNYNNASDFRINANNTAEEIAGQIIRIINEPRIAVSITETSSANAIKKLKIAEKLADFIELRADFIRDLDEKDVADIILQRKKSMIFTLRNKQDGGHFQKAEHKRIALLKKAIQMDVEFIDLELSSEKSAIKELLNTKKASKIILSHHDFSKTLSLKELESIYNRANSYAPDYVKIAAFANSINDCFKIFKLLKGKKNLIALCMGIRGQITRILAPKFGSFITYAPIEKGRESAPGQLSQRELTEEYNFKTQTPKTKLLGVIGEHAENSKSRFMHNSNFKKLGLDYIYVPLKVDADELKEFMKNFLLFDFSGCAVTVPHKESIIKYVDELDENAKIIGATNTLVNNKGKLKGFNTDFFGAGQALKEKLSLSGKKILIIGAGGAARAIIYGLKKENTLITVINRAKDRAEKLAEEFAIGSGDFKEINELTQTHDIIINTTSVGMNPYPDNCIVDDLPRQKIIMDIVYNPIQTKLINLAKKRQCITITGERMLVHQAMGQFEKWTGVKPNFEDMEKALLKNAGG